MINIIKEKFKKHDYKIALILLFLSPIISFGMVEMLQDGNMFLLNINALLTNIFMYILIYASIFALIKSVKYTTILGNLLFLIIGIGNHFVLEFRNSPILPSDMASLKTAKSVAGNYTYNFAEPKIILSIIIILCVILCALCTKNYILKNTLKKNLIIFGSLIIVVFVSGFTVYKTDFLKKIGITVNLWEQNVGYRENGFLTSFINNSKFLIIEKPVGYNVETLGDVVFGSDDKSVEAMIPLKSDQKKPNIIAIMDEAFADLQVISKFETNEDYMPFIRNMQENTIRGNMLMSVFGGNTCNSEFEFLTGNSMAFLPSGSIPYQQYVKRPIGNLTSVLNEQGYTSTAVHPYPGTGWNRNGVYENLGFSDFLTIDDFKDPLVYRCYISDESSFNKVKEVYEKNKGKGPQFIFNVTIQNHGGYNFGEDVFENTIHIDDMENTKQADQYLSLIKHTDEAFKDLIEYFEEQDEPTIIVFFGDHQPGIEQKFYEEMFKREGTSLFNLSLDEMQTKFIVPFRIWANYDIEEQDMGLISANYLSSIVLKNAGLEMPEYNHFLLKLMEQIPAMNVNGYMGNDGKYYEYTEENQYTKYINDYKNYQYNHLFDKSNENKEKYKVN